MTLVVDASVLVSAVAQLDPDGAWSETMLGEGDLAVPEIALAESFNLLRRLALIRGLPQDDAARARGELLELGIRTHPFAPYAERVWALRHNLTAYDAWYVAVAEALNCPLATLDRRLSRASGPACEVLTPP